MNTRSEVLHLQQLSSTKLGCNTGFWGIRVDSVSGLCSLGGITAKFPAEPSLPPRLGHRHSTRVLSAIFSAILFIYSAVLFIFLAILFISSAILFLFSAILFLFSAILFLFSAILFLFSAILLVIILDLALYAFCSTHKLQTHSSQSFQQY